MAYFNANRRIHSIPCSFQWRQLYCSLLLISKILQNLNINQSLWYNGCLLEEINWDHLIGPDRLITVVTYNKIQSEGERRPLISQSDRDTHSKYPYLYFSSSEEQCNPDIWVACFQKDVQFEIKSLLNFH